MEINVDSPVPAYEQIVQQISQSVLDGSLAGGDSLPAIRQLAWDLELNQNTVAKAYKKLENQRVIITAGRNGTFIHKQAARYIVQRNSEDAQYQLEELVSSFESKGMSKADIYALLETQLNLFAS